MGRSILLYNDNGSTIPFDLTEMTYTLHGSGVAVVEFAKPETYHSLTTQLRAEMFCVLEHMRRDPAVKVVVWTAQGDKAFCSGASLKGGFELNVPQEIRKQYAMRGLMPNLKSDSAFVRETKAFWDFPKPIVAAINGLCVGGGVNMALCNYFDIVMCSTAARFKLPFVDIGFTPELGSSLVLPLVMGPARAKQVVFTADWFTAKDAMEWNLVSSIHEPNELLPAAMALAERLAEKPTNQLVLSKRVLNAHLRDHLDNALRRENETILASIHDFGGLDMFANKRKSQGSKKVATAPTSSKL